ncbi:alpha/beta hydrolase [Mucilaginibacter daejeonensis]|uniref:alpha/beta hydrolase n=1 Tax=Mucilaginibacter daejeonensis TaxID=398049 RepID=UPI001D17632B|nr:alpha/beta hydrolase [Mucilaginibacter daejeonensis]UEG54061.1 alpha/beta hydrolase [Mucilaginibacter daejeonensis]
MHRYILTFMALGFAVNTYAQRTSGITKKPDTSFTNFSAYVKLPKQFKDARMVPDSLPAGVKAIRNVTYVMADGQPLKVDIFTPTKVGKALPAIMMVHGGGWRSGSPSQHHALAARLAASGYVCFTPAYRLSTQALYPAAVWDLKNALRWIKANAPKYKVDTTRMAVAGFSAGGQLAALLGSTGHNKVFDIGADPALARHTTNVQAIVDIDGILAFIHSDSGEGDDSRSTSSGTYWFGYSKDERPDLWKQASALTYVDADTPPTLFINSGVNRMHAGRQDYINILDRNHIYSEVHTFEGAPHTFCLFEPWFTPTVNYITGFLNKVLSK